MNRQIHWSGKSPRIPQSLTLALAVAGAVAGVNSLGVTTALGTIIAQDSFNYTAGQAVAGLNGGSGWGSAWTVDAAAANAWTTSGFTGGTNQQPGTNATNLSYSAFGGTGSGGGSITVAAETATSGTDGTLSRSFATPMSTTASNTFWASVEFQGNGSIKYQNYYQLTFSNTPTNGAADSLPLPANGSQHALNLLAIGSAPPVNVSNGNSGSPIYSADTDEGSGVELNASGDDLQHMFVFEIQTGVLDPSDSDPAIEVTTWWDNGSSTFLANPLGTPAATQYYDLSAAEQAGSITGVQYQASNQQTTSSNRYLFMDEVAFGTTAADVGAIAPAAVPEPGCITMLAVSGLALLARRRKDSNFGLKVGR